MPSFAKHRQASAFLSRRSKTDGNGRHKAGRLYRYGDSTLVDAGQFAILNVMATKILKEVIERIQNWPEQRQEDAAQVLIEMERQDTSGYRLTDAQAQEVARIQQNIREGRGSFATDEEMAALWKSCGL